LSFIEKNRLSKPELTVVSRADEYGSHLRSIPFLEMIPWIIVGDPQYVPNADELDAVWAEAYDGPSLIIAYAPCINHGLKKGMGKSQAEEKEAVACGYWHLWRYNPALEAEGKNPFTLDSKEPDWSKFQDFLKGEVRFASVAKQYPAEAAELFAAAEENAKWRLRSYKRMAAENWDVEA
jgi:hypothetical protein